MERKRQVLLILLLIGIFLPFTFSQNENDNESLETDETQTEIETYEIETDFAEAEDCAENGNCESHTSVCNVLEENYNNDILYDDLFKEKINYAISKIEEINDVKEEVDNEYKDVENRYENLLNALLDDTLSDSEKTNIKNKECEIIINSIDHNESVVSSLSGKIDKVYRFDSKNSKYFKDKINDLEKHVGECQSHESCTCGDLIDIFNEEIEKILNTVNEINKCKYVYPIYLKKLENDYITMKKNCNTIQGPQEPINTDTL